MDAFDPMVITESLFRWIHVLAGIMWIGHLWFFNFVNAHVVPTLDADAKKKVIPELMPRALFWFRWGAAFTWLTGVLLAGLVFYMGKIALEANATWTPFALGMLALTFLAPFVYDLLVKSVLRTGPAQFWGFLALSCVALWAYMAAGFSFRGYSIHLGAMYGTIMAFNVWFRIWPAQKQIITGVKTGVPADAALAPMAGARSKHNTFMSVPLVFLMLNFHNSWAASKSSVAPFLTMAMVLLGFGLAAHLYSIGKKVKGF